MRFSIEHLWADTDGMLEVRVSLEGCGFAAWQDLYVYPDDLKDFGLRLQSYPSGISDEPQLEVGSKAANAYCWFKLRAFVFDGVGHSALEISIQRNGAPQVSAESRFSVILEPASLNDLGKQIENWVLNTKNTLIFERPDA